MQPKGRMPFELNSPAGSIPTVCACAPAVHANPRRGRSNPVTRSPTHTLITSGPKTGAGHLHSRWISFCSNRSISDRLALQTALKVIVTDARLLEPPGQLCGANQCEVPTTCTHCQESCMISFHLDSVLGDKVRQIARRETRQGESNDFLTSSTMPSRISSSQGVCMNQSFVGFS